LLGLGFIPIPTWRDIADIIFLTIVAYQLYKWFRETRALRVLIGLVVLGGIYSLAKFWGLFLTTFVFQIFWQVLLILLLILFQSEIKQVLEKVSPLRFLRSHYRRKSLMTEDMANVVFDLAEEKTGALIVLARNDNPSEFVTSGRTIMAHPDPALIKSIFNRHSPAHDGALVLYQGKITEMGCVLPLSKTQTLPDQYGTRHRAALGLSEMTDTVCLVVSEERSEVATVMGGEITLWETRESLVQFLNGLFETPKLPRRFIFFSFENMVLKNWRSKLGALGLVFFAWMIFADQQEIKTNISAPVRYTHLSQQLSISDDSAHFVVLGLAGKRRVIHMLKKRGVMVEVDLDGMSQGRHRINVSGKNVNLPLDVRVDRVVPPDIVVALDSKKKKVLPPEKNGAGK
jgi:uncharacterized protein (TIGR00159 family)